MVDKDNAAPGKWSGAIFKQFNAVRSRLTMI
ncbi:hypothetical protein DES34_10272 [Brevibacillus brevis]|nr:hypothetical protein DES34_10272 [Brevibacillus brevis]TQK53236.1 hypothetical protein FB479_11153 [Brevibacillus sp. AG162]VEF92523.1 Uncharacterised protein [Brevibacillus brevis]